MLSVFDEVEEGLMDAGVRGQFGVERGGHGFSLPDGYGIGTFSSEDLHAFADAFDFRCANEDHFE